MSEHTSLRRIFLWLNSGCNAQCRMCDIWRERAGRRLQVEDVTRMAREWAGLGVTRVVVCGEPLLHPQLTEICSQIRSFDLRLDLLTNGLLLERKATEIAHCCDALAVSLDGPPEVHNDTRGVARAFERLLAGVHAVKDSNPALGIDARCAVHGLNFRVLPETVAAAKELGVRSISFSATDLHNEEAFRRAGRLDDPRLTGLAITKSELPELTDAVARLGQVCAPDFASGFISDSLPRLRSLIVDHYNATVRGLLRPPLQCNAPWTSAVVEYDGTVRPCFPLAESGNVFEAGGLDAVVNSEANRRFRASLEVATNPICRECVCQSNINENVAARWRDDRNEPAIAQLVESAVRD